MRNNFPWRLRLRLCAKIVDLFRLGFMSASSVILSHLALTIVDYQLSVCVCKCGELSSRVGSSDRKALKGRERAAAVHWKSNQAQLTGGIAQHHIQITQGADHHYWDYQVTINQGNYHMRIENIPHICHLFYTTTFWDLKILHSKVRKFATKNCLATKQRKSPQQNKITHRV